MENEVGYIILTKMHNGLNQWHTNIDGILYNTIEEAEEDIKIIAKITKIEGFISKDFRIAETKIVKEIQWNQL